MPQQTLPSGQDWGVQNVGKGSLTTKKPTTARGIDMAKAAGLVSTEKKYVWHSLLCLSFSL